MDRRTFLQAALALPMAAAQAQRAPIARTWRDGVQRQAANSTAAGVAWTQWGGPHRNFTTEASGIKDTWPASGPRVVWKRKLGEGYSSPAVESGVLYSMYGRRGEEVVFAANADTGQTVWEHATPMTFVSDAAL